MATRRRSSTPVAGVQAQGKGATRARVPAAPRDLDAAARVLWRSIWSLARIEPSDRASVLRLCRLESESAELRAIVREDGRMLERVVQNSRGDVVGSERYSHPAVGELRKLGREASVICDSLGLNPLSRKKMGLAVLVEPGEPDAIDELRAKRAARLARPPAPGEGDPGGVQVDGVVSPHELS